MFYNCVTGKVMKYTVNQRTFILFDNDMKTSINSIKELFIGALKTENKNTSPELFRYKR